MISISSLDRHANPQSVGEHLVCRELPQALSKGEHGKMLSRAYYVQSQPSGPGSTDESETLVLVPEN